MKQHDSKLDNRIHSFIAGRTSTSRTLSDNVATWIQSKFGGRSSEVQATEPLVGLKYETVSRGKL